MKNILTLFLSATSFFAAAQDDDCMDRIRAKRGQLTKTNETVRSKPAEYVVQKKFSTAFYNMISPYQPHGVEARWSGGFSSPQSGRPVAVYTNLLSAIKYHCKGSQLSLDHETNTSLRVEYNNFSFTELYDTSSDYQPTGYLALQPGLPEEVKPGVWKFKDMWTGLGFGIEGFYRILVFTYPGQVPWNYVTRREFLVKRKRNLNRLYAEAKKQTQEAIDYWDRFKKEKEKEYTNDAVKMANFMSGYYNPGLAEAKAKQPKILGQYEASLERLDEQLAAPAAELEKKAIVIRSQRNALDYDFTDKMEPFAEVPTKPNPAYFKRGLSPAVPQVITVFLTFDPMDQRSTTFVADIEKQLDLDYIQSFIGKTTPPAISENKSAQNSNANIPFSSTANTNTTNTKTVVNSTGNKSATSTNTTGTQSASGKTFFLTGTVSAPAGVPVTIGYNAGNDLTLTPPKSAGSLYSTSPIKFTRPLSEKEQYNVLLKKIAGNMKGVVYRGSGQAPDGVNEIKIGIDYKYELVSRSSDDLAFSNFYETATPAVGGMGGEEGRYVAFVSWTKGFAGNDGKFRQVFWRDRNTGTTKLISTSPTGAAADADCALPTMSADGQIVVFESKATNLVAGDNNSKKDIFLWRARTGTVELVSVPSAGGLADGDSYDATVSGNGHFVVFTSDAVNMSTTPKGKSLYNIFLRDVANAKTEMLSMDPTVKTGGNGVKASISFDGNRVSFCSPSGTLVANDNNKIWDIFLWERGKPALRRISLTHDGQERLQGDESASRQVASTLSGNGRYVVYSTTAPNMVPGDNLKYQDVFVYDIDQNKLQVASFTNDNQPGNHDSPIDQGDRLAITFDGTWVAFPTKATNLGAQSSNLILYNTQTGKKQIVTDTRGSYVGRPAISYSGSYVVFGKSEALDQRSGAPFGDSGGGIFAHFTGNGPCRDCKE